MNKWKIIVPIIIVLVLAFAFWYGGGAPGLQGWQVEATPNVAEEQQVEANDTKDVETDADSDVESETEPDTEATAETETETDAETEAKTDTETEDKTEDKTEDETEAKAEAESTENTESEEVKVEIDLSKDMTVEEKLESVAALAGEDIETQVEAGSSDYSEANGMVINPETGKDKYLTDPVPEGRPIPVEPENTVISENLMTCTISVRCDTILNNMEWLTEGKESLVPEDGVIFPATTVSFYEGESVFNVLLREMKKAKIHMEYENTPIYNSAYIEGINNLYEFDCGQLSGWMYKVNDWFPNYGCSRYALQDGDVVEWVFTCDLGVDVGGFSALGG